MKNFSLYFAHVPADPTGSITTKFGVADILHCNMFGIIEVFRLPFFTGKACRIYNCAALDVEQCDFESCLLSSSVCPVVLMQALLDAIRAVTDMNQDLSVEKIEIQTTAERV